MQMVRLNVFQRLVRHWEALHPYNAGQVMHLGGAPDLAAIDAAWQSSLAELGLGPVRWHGERYHFEHLEHPNGSSKSAGVLRVPAGTSLDAHITAELNRAFDEEAPLPFRPFVLKAEGGHFFGVIYHHWIADSASIRLLLRECFYRLYDPSRARRTPLKLPTGGYWHNFGPGFGPSRWSLREGLLESLRWIGRMKRVRRLEGAEAMRFDTHFSLHRTEPGLIDGLVGTARDAGVTVNDLFLAAIAQACDRFIPVQATPRRRDLALGTIVDLRSRTRADLDDTFGMFLGFTNVVCRPEHLRHWDRLVRHIAARSLEQKRRGAPEASMIRMLVGLAFSRSIGPAKTADFYRKRLPLAGGISNVNLNGSWARRYHPDPLRDYIRVSPTGPMMPVVFTPTTLGNRLHFGLTCRNSVVSPEQAGRLATFFRDRLTELSRLPARYPTGASNTQI